MRRRKREERVTFCLCSSWIELHEQRKENKWRRWFFPFSFFSLLRKEKRRELTKAAWYSFHLLSFFFSFSLSYSFSWFPHAFHDLRQIEASKASWLQRITGKDFLTLSLSLMGYRSDMDYIRLMRMLQAPGLLVSFSPPALPLSLRLLALHLHNTQASGSERFSSLSLTPFWSGKTFIRTFVSKAHHFPFALIG